MSGKTTALPVRVNGIRYDGVKAAAERMSVLLGWEVSVKWVSGVVKNGWAMTIGGVTISACPPESAPARRRSRRKPPPGPPSGRLPLLRYPPGTAPLDRGVCYSRP
jgi:hypothetical protein